MTTQGRNSLRSGNAPRSRNTASSGNTASSKSTASPEDATSWEEFRAASAAERALAGPSASPTEARSQLVLGLVFGFGAAVFWAGTVLARGAGTWALLVLAALSSWLFARYFTAGVRRGALGRRRYWELLWLAVRRFGRLRTRRRNFHPALPGSGTSRRAHPKPHPKFRRARGDPGRASGPPSLVSRGG